MRAENVELVRSIFSDWERGDVSSAAWAHPEIQFAWPDGPGPDERVGLAGMADAMREYLNAWGDWRVEADEYRALDDERVLVLQHYTARGRTSGVVFTGAEGANLFHVRDGKVTRLVCWMNRERALDDLGLGGMF